VTDEKADEILHAVRTLTNQVLRLDTNQIVLIADIEAETKTNAAFRVEMRERLGRLETAVVELAKDVVVVRDRVEEVDERHDQRLTVIEANGTNGHG
jgi:hypothetical protein